MSNQIRTRFAPSPTGFMHVGGVRTALFAWAYAKHTNGKFILRIEDTDKSREVDGSIAHIMESLKWLGIEWDEGPDSDGPFGPYKQSDRLEIYKEWAEKLIAKGLAYTDDYSQEEVDGFRKQSQLDKKPFLYREFRPQNPKVDPDWYQTKPLRFKTPEIKRTTWQDEVRGELSAGSEALDDFVIIKADGYPTYNFAHVIDDFLMEITHVMRGEEFLPSVPKFIAIHEALDLPLPKLATMPPILGASGGKKLSKRDGAKDVMEYKQEGYLPEAVVNFLMSMGWNDGTEQEIFSVEEIIAKFELERIQKSGARFDSERLVWLNGQHIRALSTDKLMEKIDPSYWPAEATDDDYKLQVLGLIHERLKFFEEIKELTWFFFTEPVITKEVFADNKLPNETNIEVLRHAQEALKGSDFNHDDIEKRLRQLADNHELKTGQLFGVIRLAITSQTVAPGLFETLEVLGKTKSGTRISNAIEALTA